MRDQAPGISWTCTLQGDDGPVPTPCPYQEGLTYQAGRRQVFLAAREEQIDALAANGTRRLQDGYVDIVVRAEVSAGANGKFANELRIAAETQTQPPQPTRILDEVEAGGTLSDASSRLRIQIYPIASSSLRASFAANT